ncbi:hypothetical protein [uncultured Sphingomonas sp.]|uniref:hypothetical protein n=1 Tax=uncultured Sphingomonas sp. TaxID=158754 RepID=UPI0030F85E84
MTGENHPYPTLRSVDDERAYLLRRAEDHLHLAEKSQEVGARAIHHRLRQMYETQAELVAVVLKD